MKTTFEGLTMAQLAEHNAEHVTTIATLEAKCAALAAENAALDNFIANSCYVWAGEEPAWHPAIDHSPETPATNQLSVEESQFLTDVITAAGLLSCGKRDKGLARRISDFCFAKRGSSNPAKLRREFAYQIAKECSHETENAHS